MRDEQWNRQYIELAIARARQERAQAAGNLLRRATRWLWICPECDDTRTMFRQRFESGEPVGTAEEIPCDYPGCNRPSISLLLKRIATKLRNAWIAMLGIKRTLTGEPR